MSEERDRLVKRLMKIQGKGKEKKEVELHVKIGVIENALLNNLCQTLNVTKSRLTRIALGHFTSYLDQLSPEEFKQELMKIIHFD